MKHLVSLVGRIESISKGRGTLFLIAYLKATRTNLLSYLSGSGKRDPLSAVTKDGIPLILGDLIPLIRGKQYNIVSIVLTILFSTRSLKLEPSPDIYSITQLFKGDVTNVGMYLDSFWRDLGYHPQDKLSKRLYAHVEQYRTKMGPNGHSLSTAICDARALPDSLVSHLVKMGGPRLDYILFIIINSNVE